MVDRTEGIPSKAAFQYKGCGSDPQARRRVEVNYRCSHCDRSDPEGNGIILNKTRPMIVKTSLPLPEEVAVRFQAQGSTVCPASVLQLAESGHISEKSQVRGKHITTCMTAIVTKHCDQYSEVRVGGVATKQKYYFLDRTHIWDRLSTHLERVTEWRATLDSTRTIKQWRTTELRGVRMPVCQVVEWVTLRR